MVTEDSNNTYDSRPPIFGRTVSSTFPEYFSFKHQPPGNIRTCMIPPVVFWQVLRNLPQLLKLRFFLKKKRKEHAEDDIRVAFYSDNLDEVNGIANNLRHVITYMRGHGYKAALVGSAFNTRPCGVVENGYVILLPRVFSMEQLGYANSELAIPHVRPILRLLKRYPVDVVELETPSPGAWAIAFCAKIAGIKVISHYRTDVPTYTKTLVKAKWMYRYVLMLMQIFYGFTRPVVSPCKDYKNILHNDIKVPLDKIEIIRRGIPLENYSPDFRGKGTWEKFSDLQGKVRFVYVGRISKEKNLPLLRNLWMEFRKKHDDAELMFVGDGWYLEELKKDFASAPEVHFAGVQGGETLAGLYADAAGNALVTKPLNPLCALDSDIVLLGLKAVVLAACNTEFEFSRQLPCKISLIDLLRKVLGIDAGRRAGSAALAGSRGPDTRTADRRSNAVLSQVLLYILDVLCVHPGDFK